MMALNDRVHAAIDSHTFTLSSCPDQHDGPAPLPNLHDLEFIQLKSDTNGRQATVLLDGRLHAIDDREPQEDATNVFHAQALLPAKQRAPPPPSLTLAIPRHPRAQYEWHIAPGSTGLSDSSSTTTHIHSDHSGVGAGYFSPPRSPDAAQSTVSLPSPSPAKNTRSRSRSVVSGGKYRGLQKMVKERRSLQTLLIPSFLHSLQSQTTPIGLVPGPRAPALPVLSPGVASSTNNSSGAGGSGNGSTRGERRRSFYSRRRSNTVAAGNSSVASLNSASSSAPVPPMPAAPGGRESPSAYLLDDDPFAPAPVPPVNSPMQSAVSTPMYSPAHSLPHSRSSSTVSLSSASSASMPGTPVFQSFGALPEVIEREGTLVVSTASASVSTITVPAPPPPASPLNPNSSPNSSSSEPEKSRGQTVRSLSATLSPSASLPTTDHLQSPSPSTLSPPCVSPSVSPLPHPPPSRARPAHTRPAFTPRPSLPSLTTLSRMSAAAGSLASPFRGRKRSGKVGAGLPAEPWNLPPPEPGSGPGLEEDVAEKLGKKEVRQEFGEDMELASNEGLSKAERRQYEKEWEMEKETVRTMTCGDDITLGEPFDTPAHSSVAIICVEPSHGTDAASATQVNANFLPLPLPGSVLNGLDDVHTSSMYVVADARISESDVKASQMAYPSPEEQGERENVDEFEVDDENVKDADEAADGEEASIDGDIAYTTLSETVNDANGENAVATTTFASLSVDTSLSGMDYLAVPEPSSSLAKSRSDDITIPIHASAIPRHILRVFTSYPFAAPRSASPASSTASSSSQCSVEDFGILLSSSSPGFRGDQRPESLTIDPALPDVASSTHAHAHAHITVLPSGKDHPYLKDTASLSEPLPLLIARSKGNPGAETGARIDLGSSSDATFAHEAEARTECAITFATSLDLSSSSRESLTFSPIATSEREGLEHPPSPIRADTPQVRYTSSSEALSLSPPREDDYTDYVDDYDYERQVEHGYACDLASEEEDSSMLPPLSTLPEDDPVFSLTPAYSRERHGTTEYGSLSSLPMSRKASVATIASIFSMRSGSSGNISQISHACPRTHSPSASLSTTLPYSNSQRGSGSLIGRRMHGSNSGSVDSGHGHAPSSSVSSLRSKSSVDLRGLANMRSRGGSQGSGLSLLSRSSTRTKYDPHVQAQARKSPSVEEVSLGLRTYSGNPYAVAVQAELEGKASKHDPTSKTRFGDDELVLDISRENVVAVEAENDAILSGWKAYDSVFGGAGVFEPGSSAGTVRPSARQPETESSRARYTSQGNVKIGGDRSVTSTLARTHTNVYGYSGSQDGAGKDWEGAGGFSNGYGSGFGGRYGSSGSDESGERRGAPASGRRGRDNSRGDGGERQSRKLSISAPSSSESESESESESSTDNYGEESTSIVHSPAAPQVPVPSTRAASTSLYSQEDSVSPIFSQLRNGRKGVFKPSTAPPVDNADRRRLPTAEDDDVPLAQRIPGALQVQNSIRQQVKTERDLRRRDRSVAPTPHTSRAPEGTISPPPQHVPSVNQDERGRTLTTRLPKSAPLDAGASPLSSRQEAAMMAQRVIQPQHGLHAARRQRAKTLSGADEGVPADVLTTRLLKVQARDNDTPMPTQRASASATTHLQPSSTKRDTALTEASSRRRPTPPQVGSQLAHQTLPDTPTSARTLRPMRSFHTLSPAAAATASTAAPVVPTPLARRPTSSRGRQSQEVGAASEELMRNKSIKSARPSVDKTSRTSAEEAEMLHSHAQAYHVPPVPVVSRGLSPPARSTRHGVVQTRIYIGDMQRFNVVAAGLETSARDVLEMMQQQGDLRGEDRRLNKWMLYEVCHDFGMERPVRSFELVTDISGSWNKEKTMNCFMVKQSPFAQSLANIPSSIPTRSGFVDYESKKGKWNKRWLELREHGLWLSKREGKDDEFLCSLSAFDAYIVTRIHKATKSFTFAVKSTDPITLFENKADYLHVFSVPEDTGMAWIEAIWLARSYILYQEKNVLFRNKPSGEGTSSTVNAGVSLTRAGTRKKPVQTYVTVAPPKAPGAAEATGPFEPGSLLAKRAVA